MAATTPKNADPEHVGINGKFAILYGHYKYNIAWKNADPEYPVTIERLQPL